MREKEIKQILKLNKKFYQSVAKDFSRTRQGPWEGWDRVEKILVKHTKKYPASKSIKILDLGCGNGRFYGFIKSKIPNTKYTGIDTNNDLLREAKEKYKRHYKKIKFIKKDVIQNLEKINGKYNVITAFGLIHHIPDENFRKEWFSKIPNLLEDKSLLIFTFWGFEKLSGDYLVGWDNKKDAVRFCHKYSKKEVGEIIKMYKKAGLKVLDDYYSDNTNRYLIFGTI